MHDYDAIEAAGCLVAETDQDVRNLAADILRPGRRQPIICLTPRRGEQRPALDPKAVRRIVGGGALIWVLTTELAFALCRLLPSQFIVGGGAARIFWPGVDEDSVNEDHPPIVDRNGSYSLPALQHLRRMFEEGPPDDRPLPPRYAARLRHLEGERSRLLHQLAATTQDLANAYERNDGLAERFRSLQDEVRRKAEAVIEHPARRAGDDRSVHAFLGELLEAYWDTLEPATRADHPLRKVTLGPDFLAEVSELTGKQRARVVRVCALVACGWTDGLELHALRAGSGPEEPQVVRGSDDAAAMRCAVQRNAPAARRLHYWKLQNGSIELANVVTHDVMSITE